MIFNGGLKIKIPIEQGWLVTHSSLAIIINILSFIVNFAIGQFIWCFVAVLCIFATIFLYIYMRNFFIENGLWRVKSKSK